MKALKISVLLSLFIAVAVLGAAQSGGPPDLPHSFYGEASLANPGETSSDSQSGTVSARVDGDRVASIELEDGAYGGIGAEEKLRVQDVSNGATITFYVNGMEAEETYTFDSGNVTELNLTVEVPDDDQPTEVSQVAENVTEEEGVDVKVPDAASKDNGGADSINISVNGSAGDVDVNVSISADKTGEAGDAPEDTEVHGYIDVNTNLEDSAITETRIGFKISESRLDAVGAGPRNVLLFHYEDGDLVETLVPTYLEDRTQRKNDGYHYFEATATGFSSFGMGSDTQDPDADIDASSTDVETGETIDFDGSGSTDNTGVKNYSWSFGDGDAATGESVSHSYGDADSYTVTLTVWDSAGNSDTDSVEVTVSAPDSGGTTGGETNDTVTDNETQEETQVNDTDEEPGQEEAGQPEDDTEEQPEDEQEVQQFGNETGPQEPQGPAGPTGLVGAAASNAAPIAAVLLLLLVAALHYSGAVDLKEPFQEEGQEPQEYSYGD